MMRAGKLLIAILLLCQGARDAWGASLEDIRALYDQQKYQDVIREASQALALRGDAARGVDRLELWQLKAESHLRLKQSSLAADAFSAAAKETEDPNRAALLRATSLLVKRSRNNTYTPRREPPKQSKPAPAPPQQPPPPRPQPPQPIDILEPASRRIAIEALYADEVSDIDARVKSLLRAANLPAVFDAAAQVRGLGDLERAVSASDDGTRNRLLSLGDIAHDLIRTSLKQMSNRIDQISRRANEKHRAGDFLYAKRGLGPGDAKELEGIKDTCDKILAAAERLTSELGTDPELYKDCIDDATKTRDRAHVVLITDYAGLYSDP
jgi:hypothetical protein